MLRGLTYLQTVSGENQGNVVLWMQPDGTLNPSADPPELPDPSDSGASYWLARTIWALGEGYRAFRDADPGVRRLPAAATRACHRRRRPPGPHPNYDEMQTVDGLQWPSWLIVDWADASSEAIYGLPPTRKRAAVPPGFSPYSGWGKVWHSCSSGRLVAGPIGPIMPWARSRSVGMPGAIRCPEPWRPPVPPSGTPGGSGWRCARWAASRLTS